MIANRSARLRLAPFARVVLYNAAANGALGERAERAGGKGRSTVGVLIENCCQQGKTSVKRSAG